MEHRERGVLILNENNWRLWRFQMEVILQAKGLYSIVTEAAPSSKEDKENDTKAKEILVTHLEDHVLAYIINCKTAHEIWEKLSTIYEAKSTVGIHLLQQRYYNLKYEAPMVNFITATEELVNKLKVHGEQISEKMVMTKILMSLPEEFKHFTSAWESVPVENQKLQTLTARLLVEEERLNNKEEKQTTALHTYRQPQKNTQEYRGQQKNTQEYRGQQKNTQEYRGQQKNTQEYRGQQKNTQDKKNEGNFKCFECGKIGHLKRNCRSRKCNYCGKIGHIYNECRQRLNKNTEASEPRAYITNKNTECNKIEWIMDTGASEHMCYVKDYFSNYTELKEDRYVTVGDGRKLKVVGIGEIKFIADNNEPSVLLNVFHVPELKVNLFSVISAIDRGNFTMISTKDGCKFIYKDVTTLIAKRTNNLYFLNLNIDLPKTNTVALTSLTEWHKRLAHQNIKIIKEVLNNNKIKYEEQTNLNCKSCIEGKQHRFSFQRVPQTTSSPGQLIHADLCGPMEKDSIGGSRYFLLLKEDYSKYRRVYFLKQKTEATENIKNFIIFTERQQGHKIQKLRTDNGTEFTNTDLQKFLQNKGIEHQTTVPYHPEQNGKAERDMRTIVEAARTMIIAKKLDKELWAEAVNTTVYILNRTSSGKEKKTPFEMWENKGFDITTLDKEFGTDVYTHIPKEKRKKWDSKSERGVFVGYEGSKGYRVYFPNRRNVDVKRDVIFLKEEEKNSEAYIKKNNNRRYYRGNINEELNRQQDIITEDFTEESTEREESIEREENIEEATDTTSTEEYIDIQNTDDEDLERENRRSTNTTEEEEDSEDEREEDNTEERKRTIRPPKWMEDYHTGLAIVENEELTYDRAVNSKDSQKWKEAIQKELEALERNKTWIDVKDANGKKVIETKWVFKIKKGENGREDIYKARLVVRGFQQKDDIDPTDIYAPVAKLPTLRILMAIAAEHNLDWTQMDVKSAFLYGNIEEEVYIKLPKGPDEYTDKIFKLQKSLYGLKKSPRNWNDKFNEFMIEEGYERSKADYCLYYKKEERCYVLLYVDDLIIIYKNKEEMKKLKNALKNRFKMTDMGQNNTKYLGINITKKENIEMDQKQYLEELLKKYNMQDCNPVTTPIEPGIELNMEPSTDKKIEHQCRQLIGSLMYAMLGTRPDLCYAISYLSRYQVYADEVLWKALKRVLRYIKGTIDYKLIYRRNSDNYILTGYTDADWAGDKATRKSTSGYVMKVYGCTVSWNSSKQQCVALSSTESEYVALSKGICERTWIKNLMGELGFEITQFKIYVDNQSALHISKNPEQHRRLKHIDLKFHFIRENVNSGLVSLEYIPTESQISDIFTKPLSRPLFHRFCMKIMC